MSGAVIELLDGAGTVYRPGDRVHGRVLCPGEGAPARLRLVVDGGVYLNLSPKSVGLFEAFYSSLKPIGVFQKSLQLTKSPTPVQSSDGVSARVAYLFDFVLEADDNDGDGPVTLLSTYKGRLVNVQYTISVYAGRGFLPAAPRATRTFVVASYVERSEGRPTRSPFKAHGYCQSHGENEAQIDLDIDMEGAIDNTMCSLASEPVTGEVTIIRSTKQITAITLTLNRIETCEYSEGVFSDTSEVHTVDVAVGNVCRNLPIPIYLPWPRIRTCPTLSHSDFSIGFELELCVHFVTGQFMVERIPIRLY